MSEEIRMSDVFETPFKPIDYQNGIVDCNGFAVLFCDMDINEKESLCSAINNHDSMLDRIAQLESELQAKTDFLALVVEEKQKLIDDKAELVEALTETTKIINAIGNIQFVEDYSAK